MNNLKMIFSNIKNELRSKDKNRILKCIGNILIIIFVAIIIKIPFIFLKTMLLDFLNSLEVIYLVQNIMNGVVEILYVIVAFYYIYNRLKKLYLNKEEHLLN